MDGTHGTKATKDSRSLRRLPQPHPRPAPNRNTQHGVVTGELDDRKRSRPVRKGAVGNRTSPKLEPRPTAYLTPGRDAGQGGGAGAVRGGGAAAAAGRGRRGRPDRR